MKFGKLTIKNFLSFRKAQIDLSAEGLFLVDGVVEGSKAFSSNGAGKSSLFEALTWVLFGNTLKDVSKDEVVNSKVNKDCSVSVVLNFGEDKYFLKRTRKHSKLKNSLTLKHIGSQVDLTADSMDNTQKKVVELLGFDYPSFINSVIFGQGNLTRYSTAPDSERKRILEEIVDLTYLPESYKKAAKSVSETDKVISQLETEQGNLIESISSIDSILKKIQIEYQTWKLGKVGRILYQCELYDGYEKELNDLDSSIDPFEDEDIVKKATDYALECNRRHVAAAEKTYPQNHPFDEKLTRELLKELGSLESQLTGRTNRMSEIQRLSKSCPVCNQRVTGSLKRSLAKQEVRKDKQRRKRIEEIKVQLVKQKDLEENLKNLKDLARLEQGKSAEAQRQLEAAKTAVLNRKLRKQERVKVLQKLIECGSMLILITKEKHHGSQTADDLVERRDRLEARLRDIGDKLKKSKRANEYNNFWKAGFSNSGIKSMILDSVIPFLNERAGIYSDILTDGEIEVKFDNTRKLSDTSREKLEVICSRQGAGKNYEGISGGEKKRSDLCISLALRDLVCSRGGTRSVEIAFFDEVFEALDDTGVERAISLLEEISKTCKTIYIATHISGLKNSLPSGITIVNTKGTSRLIYA